MMPSRHSHVQPLNRTWRATIQRGMMIRPESLLTPRRRQILRCPPQAPPGERSRTRRAQSGPEIEGVSGIGEGAKPHAAPAGATVHKPTTASLNPSASFSPPEPALCDPRLHIANLTPCQSGSHCYACRRRVALFCGSAILITPEGAISTARTPARAVIPSKARMSSSRLGTAPESERSRGHILADRPWRSISSPTRADRPISALLPPLKEMLRSPTSLAPHRLDRVGARR